MPRSRDLAILVLINRQTNKWTKPIALSLACAHGVKILLYRIVYLSISEAECSAIRKQETCSNTAQGLNLWLFGSLVPRPSLDLPAFNVACKKREEEGLVRDVTHEMSRISERARGGAALTTKMHSN